MVKIDLISGFLGAGKTTLIKKLFQSSIKNEKVVLIENEFGEIGIDGSFLKESGVKIKEINSGCICCSLVGDFATSMKEVIETYHPERVIIEPSGVGKLSDIIKAIGTVEEELEVNILCCVVDAKKVKIQLNNFGEFLHNQIEYAHSIVISKADMVNEEKLQESLQIVKTINPKANVITTNIEDLDPEDLLKVLENQSSLKDEMVEELLKAHEESHHHDEEDNGECCCREHHDHHHDEDEECCCHEHHHDHHHHHHDEEDEECCCHEHHEHHHDHDEEECCCHEHHDHHHDHDEECCCHEHHHDHDHHHHADEVFVSWGMESAKSISRDELKNFLEYLKSSNDGIILRSKGILKAKDDSKWYYFDYVAGDYSIRLGNPDFTGRIVVIGSKIDTKKIENTFNEMVK
ncbi:MAG: CobW family GTP-binding protein [Bacilli bacterium]|nr:GTP-binding protein [Bacillales bacterium]MDY2574699.1 CobW family GTP-binding protein [Bacilli bacterium]